MTPILRVENSQAVADSRDVAAYFGKNHFDVLKAVRNLQCSEEFRRCNFASFKIKDLTGESTSHVMMTKDGFTFFAMGFTGDKAAAFKEAYIAEFNRLEAGLREKAVDHSAFLGDPAFLRGALLTYTEQVIALQAQVTTLAPKAAALDQLAGSRGSFAISHSAKPLGLRPKAFFKALSSGKWIYRTRPGAPWRGYQDKVDAGLLVQKIRRDDGGAAHEQCRLTPKGLARIAHDLKLEVQLDLLPAADGDDT